ncbi:MAG: hypothetical protein U9R19_07580 [Bacteroidota bacterium]|nr:hypothetical protein [Bacteroidota bacterium]
MKTITLPAFAQNFTFAYDNAGNRTNRFIIISNKSNLQDTTIVAGKPVARKKPPKKKNCTINLPAST